METLLLTADLLLISQVQGAASSQDVELTMVPDAARALDHCRTHPVQQVLIDLSTPALQVGSLVESLHTLENRPQSILAFGPHVHAARLDEAREAGCDDVLSRGALVARLGALFGNS